MQRVKAGEVQLGWREWGQATLPSSSSTAISPARTGSSSPRPCFHWPPRHRHRLARLRRQRPAEACGGLFQLFDAAACRGHAGGTGYSGHSPLSSGDAFDRRHHRRPHAADAAGAVRARVLARSGDATRHGLQCRADRPVPRHDGEQGADADDHGNRGDLAVRAREHGTECHPALPRGVGRNPGLVRPHHRADVWRLGRDLDRHPRQSHAGEGKPRAGAADAGTAASASGSMG